MSTWHDICIASCCIVVTLHPNFRYASMEEAHLVAVSPGTPIVQGWCDGLWRGVLGNTLEPRGGGGGAPQPGDHGTHGRDMIVLCVRVHVNSDLLAFLGTF